MIEKIRQYYTRVVALVMLLLTRFYVWAQDAVDDDEDISEIVPVIGEDEEEELNLFNFGLGFTDLLIFAVVIALFFVMSNSKLKKGCWYSVLYCILVILLIIKCT